jgi:hypothetical protein
MKKGKTKAEIITETISTLENGPWLDSHDAAFKDYDAASRKRMAKEGTAMPDGSYPIANCSDWDNARRAVGRSDPGRRAAVRAHIAKRGNALGCKAAD